jgi:hypothetical protein
MSSLKFCTRSFSHAAPSLWNKLPKDVRKLAEPSPLNQFTPSLAISPSAFHSKLKTHLFKLSYPTPS